MNDDLLLSDCHRSIRTSGWVGSGCGRHGASGRGRGKDKLDPLLFPADIIAKK